MKSAEERKADFKRREDIRKAKYAERMSNISANSAALDVKTTEHRAIRVSNREIRKLRQLENEKAKLAAELAKISAKHPNATPQQVWGMYVLAQNLG